VETSLEQTSQQPDSTRLIKQWLVKCGEVYGREITSALVSIWLRELSSMDGQTINRLFSRHLKTSRFFPTMADLLAPQIEAKKMEVSESAEIGWQKVMAYVRDWVHPDITFSRAPKLPEKLDRCARAAGGLSWLRECPSEELQWRRKAFIEAYERWEQLEQDHFLLPDGEIKELFAQAAKKLSA
jgi:hypothetical protein